MCTGWGNLKIKDKLHVHVLHLMPPRHYKLTIIKQTLNIYLLFSFNKTELVHLRLFLSLRFSQLSVLNKVNFVCLKSDALIINFAGWVHKISLLSCNFFVCSGS